MKLYKEGRKLKEVSKILGVSSRTLSEIFTGKNYSYALDVPLYAGRPSGERIHNSKLTVEKVKVIREKLKLGFTGVELAKEFKVYPTIISRIKNNLIWKTKE